MFKLSGSTAALLVAGLLYSSEVSAIPIFNPATGNTYELVSSGANGSWDNAEANAVALGGHLVTLNNVAEEAWVRAAFGLEARYWIGYNDAALEGTFVWSSGETPAYIHWASNEPNNSHVEEVGEDFTVLNWLSDGSWNDWDHRRPDYTYTYGIAEYTIPEPATLAIFGLGLVGLGLIRRRRHIA